MKILLTIFLLFGYSNAQDIYQYKQAQKNKEMSISLKKSSSQNRSLNIIFYKDFDNSSILEDNYHLKLQKCIIKRVCIFDILDRSIDIDSLIKLIKIENRDIKSIQPYRAYHFKKL